MEESKLIIPDASVLIKWFVTEAHDMEPALNFKNDFLYKKVKVIVPAICTWELGNTWGRMYDSKTAASLVSMFKGYKIRETLLPFEASYLAFQIMKSSEKISFYDASYHSLAINSGGVFLTSDKKYFEKAKKFGHIKLLSSY